MSRRRGGCPADQSVPPSPRRAWTANRTHLQETLRDGNKEMVGTEKKKNGILLTLPRLFQCHLLEARAHGARDIEDKHQLNRGAAAVLAQTFNMVREYCERKYFLLSF